MSKDLLFKRVLKGICPICTKDMEEKDTQAISYGDAEIRVHKNHVKFNGEKNEKTKSK